MLCCVSHSVWISKALSTANRELVSGHVWSEKVNLGWQTWMTGKTVIDLQCGEGIHDTSKQTLLSLNRFTHNTAMRRVLILLWMEQTVNEPIPALTSSLKWQLVGLVNPQVRAQRHWLRLTGLMSHYTYWNRCKISENRENHPGVCEPKQGATYVLLCQRLFLWHFLQHMGGFLPTCSLGLDNEGSLWRRRWPGMSCLSCDLNEAGLKATI